jgi:hypothetical protein
MAAKFFSDKTQVSAQPPWKVHGALLSIMLLLAAMIYSIYLAVVTYQLEFTDVDHEPEVHVSADDDPQPLPQQEPLPLPEQSEVDLNDRSALKFAAAETVDISQLNHAEQSTPQRVNISSISLSISPPLSGKRISTEQENVSIQEEPISELVDEKPDEIAPDDASIHSDADDIEKVLQSGNASTEGIKKGRLELILDSGNQVLLESLLAKQYGRIIFGKGELQFDFILQSNFFAGRVTPLAQQDIAQLSSRQIAVDGDAAQILKKRLFETQAQAGYSPYLQFTKSFDHRLNNLHGKRELTKIRVWLCGADVCIEEML